MRNLLSYIARGENITLNIKNQGRKSLSDTAHATTVRLVAVARVHTAAIEVQTVRVGGAVLRRRPIVSVRTGFVQRTGRVVAVADSGKLQQLRKDKQTFTKGSARCGIMPACRSESHRHSFD